jgi:hypothetical protein
MATEVQVINEALSAKHTFTYDEITKIFQGTMEILTYINDTNTESLIKYSTFYVGITGDLPGRLKAHKVAEKNCYKKKQDTEFIARQIERFFTAFRKTDGDTGGRIKEGVPPLWVYCFLKTVETDPKL